MKPGSSLIRHYLQFKDFRAEEYAHLFERAASIKRRFKNYEKYTPLVDRTLAMIFEKASTRTRVSFEAGMYQMGGSVVNLTTGDSQLGRAEPVADSARVISRMVDMVMIRTYEHTKIEAFAAHSRVPVINGLTNLSHPCQVMADIMTVEEHLGTIDGKTVVMVGDGNNLAHSWLNAAIKFPFNFILACPEDYLPDEAVVRKAEAAGASFMITHDPKEAVEGAHVIYSDAFYSMGQEEEAVKRRKDFAPFQISTDLLAAAHKDHIVMHCLPAHRGEEVTAEVFDGPQSVVWDEAENRIHAQKAVLLWCFGKL